jgi:hypothetical protein
MDERFGRDRNEFEALAAAQAAFNAKPIARKCLTADDLAHIVGEVLERREAARLGVEMRKIEAPAADLTAAMLADDAVKPALQTARQIEVRTVDREYKRVVQNAGIEPVREDELEAERATVYVSRLLPFVEPGEAMAPPLCRLADGCQHRGGLETVEGRLQAVAAIRREVFKPASLASTICEAAQISTSASQMVAIPRSGTASTRIATVRLR